MADLTVPDADDYGATATLIYNARMARLLGRALLFANENMPDLDLEADRMLGALGRSMLATAEELEGR